MLSKEDIAKKLLAQKKAGQVAVRIFDEVGKISKIGTNLLEIEGLVEEIIEQAGMQPSFKGFNGYPAATCISVNDEVVHGIPRDYTLKDGDIFSLDLGVTCDGWIVDTARTYTVGDVSEDKLRLIKASQDALDAAIKLCRPGARTGDLGEIIQKTVERMGFSIVKELNGHGVGRTLQESPTIANYGKHGTGAKLSEGMTIAIEPIITLKKAQVFIEADDWTITTDNGVPAVQIEDTIMITSGDPIILTR